LFAQRQPQCPQATVKRRRRVVADAPDAPAIQIEYGKRRECIIQLTAREIDVDILIAADAAEMLEITDAVL